MTDNPMPQVSGWQPIKKMLRNHETVVGRWGLGGREKGYWYQCLASWGIYSEGCGAVSGQKFWSYERSDRPSPFYDDNGEYAEPTHFYAIPEPPK